MSVNHRWVAAKIGFSIAGVSLLRSGNRQPSIEAMRRIEQAFDWPICDQIEAMTKNYASALNEILEEKFNKEKENQE